MKIDLTGKTALITGGAAGIGRECARVLAAAGASVIVVDINLQGAQQTVADIGKGLAIRCDLGDPGDVSAMRSRVASEVGGIDILVNCAGIISFRQAIGDVSLEEWDRVLDVNLRGTYLVCQEFMEELKQRRGGKIINFSSLSARIGAIEAGIHYAASKGALIAFTQTLAKEGAPFGINVNAVAPGIIATEPVKRQFKGREDATTAMIPLQRLGQPRDVANVVLFLASPLSDYITGSVLDVNGGMYMG